MLFRIFGMVLLLNGCVAYSPVPENQIKEIKPNIQIEHIPVAREDLAKTIVKSGCYLYQVGEFTKIYIPVDKVFRPMTAQWQDPAKLLVTIAKFISSYDVTEVNVVSLLPGSKANRFNNAIASNQAQKVARALLSKGLDARIVTARGAVPFDQSPIKGGSKYTGNIEDIQGVINYIVVEFRYHHHYLAR